ncbi:MAG: hypothetical protein EBZ59_13000, partial [Planctomycetia bacterium]|nr:hypothetical protein [Planctomycetia bacterium]
RSPGTTRRSVCTRRTWSTDSFAAPDQHHLGASLGKLEQRTPLGASDVIAGLRSAAGLFGDGERTKAIVYVGDGPSWAGVDAPDFAELVDLLRARRIPVSVAGVGPEVNWPLLAALANQTGGVVIVPAANENASDVGRTLAARAVQTVAWPVEREPGPAEMTKAGRVLPVRLPPLRADRESIVLIGGHDAAIEAEFAFVSPAGERLPVRVLVPEVASKNSNAFLAELFGNASPTDGLFLPLLGSQGLEAAQEFLLGEARSLADLSRQAEDAGMRDSAIRLAEASLRRDPDNPVARRVRTVALQSVAPPADAAVEELAPPARIDGASEDAPASELGELAQMRRVRGQQLEQETAVRIREARQLLSSDPDGARSLLQRTLNEIRDSADLDPAA